MNVQEECQILAEALSDKFPTGWPVFIHWHEELTCYHEGERIPIYADCTRIKKGIRIRMSRKKCRQKRVAFETLIHEYAHAMEWKGRRWEHHPANLDGERDHTPAFWAQYGELYEWFFHQGGRQTLEIGQ